MANNDIKYNKNKIILTITAIIIISAILVIGVIKSLNKYDTVSHAENKPMPEFSLAGISEGDSGVSKADLIGEVSLVNIWGSWCIACIDEHPALLAISESIDIQVIGIDWQEKNPQDGARWLQKHGNPYDKIGADPESVFSIQMGITGAPESFIVDKKGNIRWVHRGIIDDDFIENILLPLVNELKQE